MALLEFLVQLFIFCVGLVVLAIAVVFFLDITQTKHAVLRNFPVIGHFRYLFERLGEFFQQYSFAMDREELPFNRAQRTWVYRAAADAPNTVAFGSTRDLGPTGTVIFVNCPYPMLDRDAAPTAEVVIGPQTPNPYTSQNTVHISGMNYGALSRPATLALSNGARRANIWLNTEEGGVSPHHLEGGADLGACAVETAIMGR